MTSRKLHRSVLAALLVIGCGGKLVVDAQSNQDGPSPTAGFGSGGTNEPVAEAGTRATGGTPSANQGGTTPIAAGAGPLPESAGASTTAPDGGNAAAGAGNPNAASGQGGQATSSAGEGGVNSSGAGAMSDGGAPGAGGARDLGEACSADAACASNACDFEAHQCIADACKDHHQDGAESDADCGGTDCAKCTLGRQCQSDLDCTTNACDGVKLVCVPNQCIDHRTDGNETDVDCGGVNSCSRCVVGQHCNFNFDCQAGHKCDMAADPKVCAPY